MPNNPVQIVLNSSEYVGDADTTGGGRHTDFYANRDGEFARHRAAVIGQIEDTREYIAAQGQAMAYAKVRMSPTALAKSHRPTTALFKPEWTPVVGVSDLGELLVEVTASSLDSVRRAAQGAELETRIVPDQLGTSRPKPTRTRSELGAVERFDRYRAEDKRNFSAEQSARWFTSPAAGDLFVLQLFRPLSELRAVEMGSYSASRQELLAFELRLTSLRTGVRLSAPTEWWAASGYAVLRLPIAELDEEESLQFLQRVLELLDDEPLVRRIMLPPILRPLSEDVASTDEKAATDWQDPNPDSSYAVVGLVDSGVTPISALVGWIDGVVDIVDPVLQNQKHGTFIAGLLADDSALNDFGNLAERPCKIYDMGLNVTTDHLARQVYPQGFIDLLEQLDAEIASARSRGVRVFNMSLSAVHMISDDTYGPFAAKLDDIVDRHDIILVLPAGNWNDNPRDVWADDADEVLKMLGNYRHAGADRIYQPAESLRSVTVGAVDPVCVASPYLRPSQYTRRGPGIGMGRKPDMAHIGGASSSDGGLRSFGLDGALVTSHGTSFAAPLVAKTLANLDYVIEGVVQRETVVALAIHGAEMPPCTSDGRLKTIAGDFVGFGVPPRAETLLSTDDNGITLVFESSIRSRQELDFSFQWPESLVDGSGHCRGTAMMTLVYRPPLNPSFGSETVRVNVEAFLRQEHVDRHSGVISQRGFFSDSVSAGLEKHRIEQGLKWHTVKRWTRTSPRGIGTSSQWKVVVASLARQGVSIPPDGISFSLVLTLSDPANQADVFNQMRRSLRASNVRLADIQTSYRLRT